MFLAVIAFHLPTALVLHYITWTTIDVD